MISRRPEIVLRDYTAAVRLRTLRLNGSELNLLYNNGSAFLISFLFYSIIFWFPENESLLEALDMLCKEFYRQAIINKGRKEKSCAWRLHPGTKKARKAGAGTRCMSLLSSPPSLGNEMKTKGKGKVNRCIIK